MTRDDAYFEALGYVHRKLSLGATAESMRRTAHEGFGGPNEPGYELQRGRMTVPGVTGERPRWTFSTDDLVADLQANAREEFWRRWRAYRQDRTEMGYLGLAIEGLRTVSARSGLLPAPDGPIAFEASGDPVAHHKEPPVQDEPVQADLFGEVACR